MSVFNFPIAFFLAPENNYYYDMFDDKHVVVSPSLSIVASNTTMPL